MQPQTALICISDAADFRSHLDIPRRHLRSAPSQRNIAGSSNPEGAVERLMGWVGPWT
jgi:hypothetical protein